MRKILLVCLFCSLFCSLFPVATLAQKVIWQKDYFITSVSNYSSADMIETSDGRLAVLSVKDLDRQGLMILDATGDTIYTTEFPIKYHPSYPHIDMYVTACKIDECEDKNLIVTGLITNLGFQTDGYIFYRKMKKENGELLKDLWYLPGYPPQHDRFASQTGALYGQSALYNKKNNMVVFLDNSYDDTVSTMKAELTFTDSTGKFANRKTYKETFVQGKILYVAKLRLKPDGGYLGTGNYTIPNQGFYGVPFIVSTDSAGNLKWSQKIYTQLPFICWDLRGTKDGGCIALLAEDPWKPTQYLYKYDNLGNLEWSIGYNLGQEFKAAVPNTVLEDKHGGYVVAGKVFTNDLGGSPNVSRFFVLKTDKNGEKEWQMLLDTMTNDYFGFSFLQKQSGNYVLAGHKGKGHLYLTEIEPPKTGVELEAASSKEVLVSCNASSTELRLEFLRGVSNVRLSSVLGADLGLKNSEQQGVIRYDISGLGSGLYFISWQEQGIIKSKKFVVRR